MPTYCKAFIDPVEFEACELAPIKIPTQKEKEGYLNYIAEYCPLPLDDRCRLYMWLLEYAENCEKTFRVRDEVRKAYNFYFCTALDRFNVTNYAYLMYKGKGNRNMLNMYIENLPELMAFKPDGLETRDPWFDYDKDPEALKKRIFILECCIILTSPE